MREMSAEAQVEAARRIVKESTAWRAARFAFYLWVVRRIMNDTMGLQAFIVLMPSVVRWLRQTDSQA